MHASGIVFGEQLKWSIDRKHEEDRINTDFVLYHLAQEKKKLIGLQGSLTLPLIAFYGPHRSAGGRRFSLEAAISEKVSRLDGYKLWNNALADRDQLETWVAGKTLEQLQLISEGQSPSEAEKDELQIVNEAISRCIPYALGLKYDLRRRSLVVEFAADAGVPVLPFSNLSDGQQGMISLVADIARRMCILNPILGAKVLRNTSGILAIDELDLHLHPAWQRRILSVLQELFPLIQIFATAHSPQMIGGLHPDQVIVLKDGRPEQPQVTFGLDSSQILEEIMGADSREPTVRNVLKKMFENVEKGDLEGAKRQLREIKLEAPDLPDYAQLEALIRRKETLGR